MIGFLKGLAGSLRGRRPAVLMSPWGRRALLRRFGFLGVPLGDLVVGGGGPVSYEDMGVLVGSVTPSGDGFLFRFPAGNVVLSRSALAAALAVCDALHAEALGGRTAVATGRAAERLNGPYGSGGRMADPGA